MSGQKKPDQKKPGFVPPWMADLGIKAEGPNGWLNMSKAQLRSQQRPDRPLKVRVWATGMLHSPGYNGQEATTLRNGRRVPLTPGDIIHELWTVERQYYEAAGIKATEKEWKTLKESTDNLRRVMAALEDDGVAMRTDTKGTPLCELPPEQSRRLPSGRTRMFFWLVPRSANPENVKAEWQDRQPPTPLDNPADDPTEEGEKPEVGIKCLPVPPIWQILKVFQIEKPDKAQISDPTYQKLVEQARVAARKVFVEVVTGGLRELAAEVGIKCLPDVGIPGRALESKDESKKEESTPVPPPSSPAPRLFKESHPSVGRSKEDGQSKHSPDQPTDRPTTDDGSAFKPRIREFLESKFKTAIPGFPLKEAELAQIAATIHSEIHLKQFFEAAQKQKHPRGWIVFVKIALACQDEHAKYEKALATGSNGEKQETPMEQMLRLRGVSRG